MIVNCRLEVTDEQRAALACLLTPKRPARLATRKEFNEYVEGCIAAIPELGVLNSATNVAENEPTRNFTPKIRASGRMSLNQMIERARREDARALAGKTDGFVIGWCKVKYTEELRG